MYTITTFVEHIGFLCTHELKYMEFILTFVHLKPKLVEQNGHTTHVNYTCGVVGFLCKHKLQSMDHIKFLCTQITISNLDFYQNLMLQYWLKKTKWSIENKDNFCTTSQLMQSQMHKFKP
jgi:hypothetical protein